MMLFLPEMHHVELIEFSAKKPQNNADNQILFYPAVMATGSHIKYRDINEKRRRVPALFKNTTTHCKLAAGSLSLVVYMNCARMPSALTTDVMFQAVPYQTVLF